MRATFATVVVLAAAPLGAQDGAFVVRLGDDTLLVEQYRLSGNPLAGDQVSRAARVPTVRHFTATLDRRGGVVRYELAGRPAATPDARPQTLRVSFDADTAVIELRSEEHTSELQSQSNLVCRLLLEKKKKQTTNPTHRCS